MNLHLSLKAKGMAEAAHRAGVASAQVDSVNHDIDEAISALRHARHHVNSRNDLLDAHDALNDAHGAIRRSQQTIADALGVKNLFSQITVALLFMFACFGAIASPLGPQWSGIWEDVGGQHRCAISTGKSMVMVCALGDDAVTVRESINPPQLTEMPAWTRATDFGSYNGVDLPWGTISIYAYCDRGPVLQVGFIRFPAANPTSVLVDLRPVTHTSACALEAR